MAFVKYEVEAAVKPEVKVNGTTIVISESAWAEVGLQGADWVNLYWDAKVVQIGLTSTAEDDPSKFRVKKNSRGISIPAKPLFDKFRIGPVKPTGKLREVSNMVCFKVASVHKAESGAHDSAAPKRRGRPPRKQAS